MSYEYIALVKAPKTFRDKPVEVQALVNQTLHILISLGLPLEGLTFRRLEKMALAILAIVDVRHPDQWRDNL